MMLSLSLFHSTNPSPAPNQNLLPSFLPRPRNPTSLRNPRRKRSNSSLYHVSLPDPTDDDEGENVDEVLSPSSVAALAAAIRRASTASPVQFTQRVEKPGRSGLVLPSPDFHRICIEQLDLFRAAVHRDAMLSVFVRPAGSYVMDQLELRRVTFYPGIDMSENADSVILVGNFSLAAGLHAAETSLSKQQVEFVSEYGAVVLPMVKHPFVVGFLIAELPRLETEVCENAPNVEQHQPFYSKKDESPRLPPYVDKRMPEIQAVNEEPNKNYAHFSLEQKSIAIMISRSLAMAYVMDQKAMLLQQSSWQNNVRISHLVEQIRGSLSNIRALSKMLSVHLKRNEISHDITENILMQGDHVKDTLQQLQDAVYLTKDNIVQYNEDMLRRMHDPTYNHQESFKPFLSDYHVREPEEDIAQKMDALLPLGSKRKNVEIPMPPLLLAPIQKHGISEVSHPLHVAVEESALRQALSNLIEGALLRTQIGGRVEIYATSAPAGGTFIAIDDNGPDMHYMTQMRSLTPFRENLLSDGKVEDNVTWNFVAGVAVAREVLENYGCVVRVISPRTPDVMLGARGTRIELWLPSNH